MAVSAKQLAFVQFRQNAFPITKPQLLPVELFGFGFSMVKFKSSVIFTITTLGTFAAQIDDSRFLPFDPTVHLAAAQAFLAVGMNSADAFAIKGAERQFALALKANFVHRYPLRESNPHLTLRRRLLLSVELRGRNSNTKKRERIALLVI